MGLADDVHHPVSSYMCELCQPCTVSPVSSHCQFLLPVVVVTSVECRCSSIVAVCCQLMFLPGCSVAFCKIVQLVLQKYTVAQKRPTL